MKSINLKFVFVFLLSIAMFLSVSACATDSDADSDETDAAVTEAPAEGEDIVAAYVFTNTGSAEICELYLSPADLEDWGPDQLKSQTIAAGADFTLTNIPAGYYDAKAVGCNGTGEAVIQLDISN